MGETKLSNKIADAAKWSALTEVMSKAVSPVTNMILARLLTPEAFGVVATVNIVFSFADLFSDAGFQKFIIQHEFRDEEDCVQSANVAFWTNFTISVCFWLVIGIFSDRISLLVGSPGLGMTIIAACGSLPLTALTSIQIALYRRSFDFKNLFYVKMIGIVVPFIVTIPLALISRSYWALIVGTVVGNLANAIVLTMKSKWKPQFYYSIAKLKKMIAFSLWTLTESVVMWLNSYADTFIVGLSLSAYYLGLYKTSMTTTGQITNLIVNATVPVLFAALSRMQTKPDEFVNTYFMFQRYVGILLIPIGVGLYLYRDFVTLVLLGKQWEEAALFIGIWGMSSSVCIVLGQFASEALRATGKTRIAVLSQFIQFIILVPAISLGKGLGYDYLVYIRTFVRLAACAVSFVLLKISLSLSIYKTIKNLLPYFISAAVMGVFGWWIRSFFDTMLWNLTGILLSAMFYFIFLYLFFPSVREDILSLGKKVIHKVKGING